MASRKKHADRYPETQPVEKMSESIGSEGGFLLQPGTTVAEATATEKELQECVAAKTLELLDEGYPADQAETKAIELCRGETAGEKVATVTVTKAAGDEEEEEEGDNDDESEGASGEAGAADGSGGDDDVGRGDDTEGGDESAAGEAEEGEDEFDEDEFAFLDDEEDLDESGEEFSVASPAGPAAPEENPQLALLRGLAEILDAHPHLLVLLQNPQLPQMIQGLQSIAEMGAPQPVEPEPDLLGDEGGVDDPFADEGAGADLDTAPEAIAPDEPGEEADLEMDPSVEEGRSPEDADADDDLEEDELLDRYTRRSHDGLRKRHEAGCKGCHYRSAVMRVAAEYLSRMGDQDDLPGWMKEGHAGMGAALLKAADYLAEGEEPAAEEMGGLEEKVQDEEEVVEKASEANGEAEEAEGVEGAEEESGGEMGKASDPEEGGEGYHEEEEDADVLGEKLLAALMEKADRLSDNLYHWTGSRV